uniref:GPI ethanolamine phosphate transferase n=1 Tax=Anoplophora glabripennis TaxID=217634 RepID=V5GN82_ANOGL
MEILAQYFFYAFGHQPTFPNISWEAAFIGTSGIFFSHIIQGTLIIINTFCSYILMGLLLPLLLITPFTVFIMIPSVVGKKPNDLQLISTKGEMGLIERNNLMLSSIFVLSCKYIMGHGIRVFASMLAATVHCRHLMVWKIFAPKFIFEAVGMFVTLISVMIGYLIVVRINKKVENLIITLNKFN